MSLSGILEQEINLEKYLYELPTERIALFPLEKRDQAKLQVYRKGEITHSNFYKISQFLPPKSLLVFNNTRVIPARLYFRRSTGALIEIFLLQPALANLPVNLAMQERTACTWKCMIGNKKRWKEGEVMQQKVEVAGEEIQINVRLEDRENMLVHFWWTPTQLSFAEILSHLGEIPLPPYLNRDATEQDKRQYQTVYARKEGAVAAPTAGLHFTDEVLQSLEDNEIFTDFLTLHVGAGTFQPIKEKNILQHPMHKEQIIFTKSNINKLLLHAGEVIAVGTTSVRALESLFWYGVKLFSSQEHTDFKIEKLFPYSLPPEQIPGLNASLTAVLQYMESHALEEITGETEILIVPGYCFRVCKGLITNYHLPGSTLLLLIAAFIGEDWRKVYEEALRNNYRFLSYGDSSLLLP